MNGYYFSILHGALLTVGVSLLALLVLIYMEQMDAAALGELDGREEYRIVQIEPSDPI